MTRRAIAVVIVAIAVALASSGCVSGNDDAEPFISLAGATTAAQFPEIVGVDATYDPATATWTFDVTISSPYDTPERYADGWRVIGADGTVYGTHTLTHDHAAEQPFTRTQTSVEIPLDVDEVTIEGRDLLNGFGGPAVTVSLQAGES
jgi:hypothetical protein